MIIPFTFSCFPYKFYIFIYVLIFLYSLPRVYLLYYRFSICNNCSTTIFPHSFIMWRLMIFISYYHCVFSHIWLFLYLFLILVIHWSAYFSAHWITIFYRWLYLNKLSRLLSLVTHFYKIFIPFKSLIFFFIFNDVRLLGDKFVYLQNIYKLFIVVLVDSVLLSFSIWVLFRDRGFFFT